MPVVKSHNKLAEYYCEYELSPDRGESSTISQLVAAIATEILTKEPIVVADAASGKISKKVLENKILHFAETKRHNFGYYRDELLKRVLDFMFGYGPLQELIEQEEITDIDGTGYNEFSVKIAGRRMPVSISFPDEKTFDTYCRLMIIRNGGIINENDSHCRVVDEKNRLRINVSISPRNISGPCICIRKHRKESYGLDELEKAGMLCRENKKILLNISAEDSSVVFCGKGASGKTTLLRAFINTMPEMERLLVVESDSELYPQKPYCIVQRIKKANEGGRSITLKELVADGLTMSLDTYCVGEIVGDEAWEFLRASFSGHRCLATTHSESASDTMDRLLTLARPGTSGESELVMKKIIGSGIDYIVYLKSFKVIQIIKIAKYNESEDRYEVEIVWE